MRIFVTYIRDVFGYHKVWFSNQNIWLDFYAFFIGVFVAPGIGGVLALLTDVNGSPDIKIPSSTSTPSVYTPAEFPPAHN